MQDPGCLKPFELRTSAKPPRKRPSSKLAGTTEVAYLFRELASVTKNKKKAFEKRRKQKKNRSGCLSPTNDTRVKWQRSLRRGKVATLIHRSPELSRFFSLSPPLLSHPGEKTKGKEREKQKKKKPRTTRQTGRTRQQCETRSVNGVAHTAREVF